MASMSIAFPRLMFRDRAEMEITISSHAAQCSPDCQDKSIERRLLATREDLQLVAAISRQLDGIPLAIEFAAARVATIGLQQVAARLHDRFNLLTRGLRTALPRHQTLLATLDWSYELLSETEARVLRHLAVFNGDFSLDAAAAVIGNFDAVSVADDLAGLVVKSLVVADFQARDDHYRLLDTTRAYALQSCAARRGTGKPHVAMRNTSGKPSFRLRQRAIPCRKPIGRSAMADTLGNSPCRPRMGILRRRRRADRRGVDCRCSAALGPPVAIRRMSRAHGAGACAAGRWRNGFNTLAHAASRPLAGR